MLASSAGYRLTRTRCGLIRSYLRTRKSSTARLWKNLDRRAGRLRSASVKRRNLRRTQPPTQKRTTRTHLRKHPMWRAHTSPVKLTQQDQARNYDGLVALELRRGDGQKKMKICKYCLCICSLGLLYTALLSDTPAIYLLVYGICLFFLIIFVYFDTLLLPYFLTSLCI